MSNLEKIVKLSESDYTTLSGGGSVTRNGVTLTGINNNYLYVTESTISLSDIDPSMVLPTGMGGTGNVSFTSGALLTGNGSGALTTTTKTSAATANTVVERDGSGNFSAGTITANLTGTATSANYVKLYEARGTTTTLNKAANYVAAGAMFHLIATSNTSAENNGKTPTDANVLQMNWDNNGGYDGQIAVSTNANRLYFRDRPSANNPWQEVAHAPVGASDIGSSTQPVYMTSTGVITACTSYANASVNYATSAGSATTATNLASAPTITATGTSTIDLTANTTYTLTAGGKSIAFKTPTDSNNYVRQAASSTDQWRKILLHYQDDSTATASVTDATNITYAAVGVAVQSSTGTIRAKFYNVFDKVQLEYNSTDQSLDFVFI